MTIYRWSLVVSFVAVWVWAAIDPLHRADWLLENYLVFIFVPIVLLTGRFFRLSDLSYTFITLFLMMHVLGSHYTYAETPFGNTLQDWFGANRNMYDRFVHFAFGLLLAYPMREVFLRVAKTTGVWGGHLWTLSLNFFSHIRWAVIANAMNYHAMVVKVLRQSHRNPIFKNTKKIICNQY